MNRKLILLIIIINGNLFSKDWLGDISPDSKKIIFYHKSKNNFKDSIFVKDTSNKILFSLKYNGYPNNFLWINDSCFIYSDNTVNNFLVNINDKRITILDKLKGVHIGGGIVINNKVICLDPFGNGRTILYYYSILKDSLSKEILPIDSELWTQFSEFQESVFIINKSSELGMLNVDNKEYIPIYTFDNQKVLAGEGNIYYLSKYELLLFSSIENEICIYSMKKKTIKKISQLSDYIFPVLAPNKIDLYVSKKDSSFPNYKRINMNCYIDR